LGQWQEAIRRTARLTGKVTGLRGSPTQIAEALQAYHADGVDTCPPQL
jgi:hypothetical protein